MEKTCPFCSARAKSREGDEDYQGYYHYTFACGSRYSWYNGQWTNLPSFGEDCAFANILKQEEHFTDIHRLQELYKQAEARHAEERELQRQRDAGELIKVQVKYDKGYKAYVFEAPGDTQVDDVVVVESQYSSNGYSTARVVELGGEYNGRLAQVVTVIKKRDARG